MANGELAAVRHIQNLRLAVPARVNNVEKTLIKP